MNSMCNLPKVFILNKLIFTLLVTVCVACRANPTEYMIGSAKIAVSPPDNYCALDSAYATDRKMLSFLRESNTLNYVIGAFAECNNLHAWRNGQNYLREMAECIYGNCDNYCIQVI